MARQIKSFSGGPPLASQVASFAGAIWDWSLAGFPVVDEATLQARSGQCAICPRWDARQQRCMECGCGELKHRMATERCPLGRW